jgi:YgiT-type zinc finger domain-containing protein
MKKKQASDLCPFCGGAKRPGTTTFTAELGFGVVVVRQVPASVCSQCGADWISDKVAGKLETLVAEAKTKRLQVEVTALG